MASIDLAPEPLPAVARAEGVWSQIRYPAASHPLGVPGAVIVRVFVVLPVFRHFLPVHAPTAPRAPSHRPGSFIPLRPIQSPDVVGCGIREAPRSVR